MIHDPTNPRKYRLRFKVEGSGRFPIDMLRHSECYPESSDDAMKILSSLGGVPGGGLIAILKS